VLPRGGTLALKDLLTHMPNEIPPVLIVQHIPPGFSKSFADRLNELCPFEVKEAENGDQILPNRVLIAPGGLQMTAKRLKSHSVIRITDSESANRHKPSVDTLFESIASEFGSKSIGIILTGMGKDGALGLLRMREAGSFTMAQDEESSVVFGMPKEAIRIGAAQKTVSLLEMPFQIGRAIAKRFTAA
jgi:two-component system chemotaxis response regulator CheB